MISRECLIVFREYEGTNMVMILRCFQRIMFYASDGFYFL